MVLTSFISVSIAFALMAYASTTSDFSYAYVWEHTSTDLDPIYRFSAVWAGGSGALLVCSWLMALVLVIEYFVRGRRHQVEGEFRSAFIAIMSLLVAFFSAVTVVSGLFDRTADTALMSHPEGLGMDVALQTPEMILHAPLIFIAYAALAAVFSASASYYLTGDSRWISVGLPWGRLAWFTLTSGIVLGAVWAYYVIGWGGYWSWDPVETASLIPWLMTTAFLHTQVRYATKGEYASSSPLFGMMSFTGVAFVSFIVRAGGLWKSSVHDYGVSAGASAVSRFFSILQEDPMLVGTLGFLILLVVATALLFYRKHSRETTSAPHQKASKVEGIVSDRSAMLLTIVLLTIMALAAILLMFKNIQSDMSTMSNEFNQKMSMLSVALMVALSMCLAWRLIGRERTIAVCIGIVVTSVALGALGAVSGAFNGLVAFCVPSFIFAMGASAVRAWGALSTGTWRVRMFRVGAQVTHLGTTLLLVSFVMSSNLQMYPEGGSEVPATIGSMVTVGDYAVRLEALQISDDVMGYPAGVSQVRIALVDISRDGRLIEDDARMEILYGFDPVAGYAILERGAFVKSHLSEDLYMSFRWMTEDVALLHIKVVPMMTPLWTGAVLILLGISFRIAIPTASHSIRACAHCEKDVKG